MILDKVFEKYQHTFRKYFWFYSHDLKVSIPWDHPFNSFFQCLSSPPGWASLLLAFVEVDHRLQQGHEGEDQAVHLQHGDKNSLCTFAVKGSSHKFWYVLAISLAYSSGEEGDILLVQMILRVRGGGKSAPTSIYFDRMETVRFACSVFSLVRETWSTRAAVIQNTGLKARVLPWLITILPR
jgi:hypothetical protein